MAQYRLSELDLSTRLQLTAEMVLGVQERGWGRASQLAQQYGVSRTLLYEWRAKALQSLSDILQPHGPGPRPLKQSLEISDSFIQRAIALWPMLTGSVRGIQTGLELLLGVERSVGYISQTLQAAGQKAATYNQAVVIPLPVLAEADEIFQGRRPCLTVVDGRSFLALNLSPAESRDATQWGVTFLDLAERGIQFHDLVSDGAKGIRAGIQQAQLGIPVRPDLFHLLQAAQPITRRLERDAYQAIEVVERVRRAEREALADQRRPGRPLKVEHSLAEALRQETQAITQFDLWCWLLHEARLALEPIQPGYRLGSTQTARDTLQAVVALMKQVGHQDVTAFGETLLAHLEDLVAPLAGLEQTLSPWRANLSAADEALILWYTQQRSSLTMSVAEAFSPTLQAAALAFVEALTLFHRASSLAESLHSWLRPHLQIHRGMPAWLAPLLQLFWNHHRFQRGKRAGNTPLELAGVIDAPTLAAVLDHLFMEA